MKYAPYSYSKISTYNSCPRKFKYMYIDKIPKEEKDDTPLRKGSFIHSLIEHNGDKNSIPKKELPILTSKEEKEFTKIYNKFKNTELYKRYIETHGKHEVEFGIDKNLNTCGYFDEDCLVRGRIDYMCMFDKLNIVDWKTGKVKPPQYQDGLQTLIYSLWAFQKFKKIRTVEVDYVYVEHIEKQEMLYDRKYINNYRKTLLKNIIEIEKDEVFEKKPNLCDWCEYQQHCKKDI